MGKKWPHTRTSIFERLNMPSSGDSTTPKRPNELNRESWSCLGIAIVVFLFALGVVCYTAYKTASLFAPHNS